MESIHVIRNLICLAVLLSAVIPGLGGETDTNPIPKINSGFVVHLGCGDGTRTAQLGAGSGIVVHGLDVDRENVLRARANIQSLGQYGAVSVDTFDGVHLPYIDNMVNLVVADHLGAVSNDELIRVLVPGGVACVRSKVEGQTSETKGDWQEIVKPWPTDIDQWTHYLHGPDNNAVANDTVVGPPRGLQWQGGPKWTRHHDHMASMSALVSTGGRLFYIMDEGSTASIYLPSHWALIARDAFNGKILWKRSIDTWYSRFKGLKDGPADAPRRLVASGDRVYATLSLHGPVTALDTASGETVRQFEATDGAEEILLSEDNLFVLVGPGSLGDGARSERPLEKRTIVALNADSGDALWQKTDVVAATTMAVDAQRIYYFNFDRKSVVGLDRQTGTRLWTSAELPTPKRQTSFFASKLVVHDGVVLFAGGEYSGLTKSGGGETRSDTLTALSAESGEVLWTAQHPPSGYSSPENVFVIDGIVWCDASSNGRLDGTLIGMDLHTGEVKHEFPTDQSNYWFHHRCYPGRASSNYIMTSRTGIEFIDFRQQHWDLNHWIRGGCLYGIMPCNGLVYTPPSPCICYAESMLHSFNAFAPAGRDTTLGMETPNIAERLERGPSYEDDAARPTPSSSALRPCSWPTYRGTNSRSGCSQTVVPAQLGTVWSAQLEGKLSSITVAAGKVFVAAVDDHTVYGLDADSGAEVWSYTVGGRVDSPPTFHAGRVLFGSADGWVYCLRADDGELVWRFRAAPMDRRLMAYEQIESLWPVHGSVLVQDDTVHFVAGRSIFVDGGMRLIQLDAQTGELVSETVLDKKNPETGNDVQELIKWLNMPVGRPDILSSDGQRIFMRSQVFDLRGRRLRLGPVAKGPEEGSRQGGETTHLFCPTGFLDDTSFHRTYWMYGSTWSSGWNGYFEAGKHAPAGKIMCVGDDRAFVFGRLPQYYRWTTPMEFHLFAARKQWTRPLAGAGGKKAAAARRVSAANEPNFDWSIRLPLLVRAMVLADKTLFVAGPRDVLDESTLRRAVVGDRQEQALAQEAALAGERGAVLWAVSADDGSKLAEVELDSPPVFDGMAAASGRLYVTTIGGQVVCLGR